MTKVLKVNEDITAKHESYEDKVKAIAGYIESTHLAFNDQGVSHIALIDRGGGSLRLINGKDLPTLMQFIKDTEESDGPFVSVHYMEVHTRQ